MRKKNYKGAKVSKRVVAKCEGVCRTYDAIQYAYANLLSEAEEVKLFQVNVLLQGLEEGAYTSDFVITKSDGNLMVRECVSRKHLTKPMTTKLLDASSGTLLVCCIRCQDFQHIHVHQYLYDLDNTGLHQV